MLTVVKGWFLEKNDVSNGFERQFKRKNELWALKPVLDIDQTLFMSYSLMTMRYSSS